jgi:response regulator RpfG family c-di-GMP phosphodiesterase
MQGPKKILIVEPDRSFRRTLQALLQDDYELVSVVSGEDALERTEQFVPDIVVVADHIDAEALLSKLRLHSRLQDATARLKPASPTSRTCGSKLERLIAERTRDLIANEDVSIVTLTLLAEYREPEGGQRLWLKRYYASIVAARLSRQGPYAGRIDVTFIDNLYRATALHDTLPVVSSRRAARSQPGSFISRDALASGSGGASGEPDASAFRLIDTPHFGRFSLTAGCRTGR